MSTTVRVVCGVMVTGTCTCHPGRGEPRVLVTKRREGKDCAGQFEFPGGAVENGETDAAALARELGEELDVAVRVRDELGRVVFKPPVVSREALIVFYRADIVAGLPRPLAADEMRWSTMEELRQLDMTPASTWLLEHAGSTLLR